MKKQNVQLLKIKYHHSVIMYHHNSIQLPTLKILRGCRH